jgi:hypothetical protein
LNNTGAWYAISRKFSTCSIYALSINRASRQQPTVTLTPSPTMIPTPTNSLLPTQKAQQLKQSFIKTLKMKIMNFFGFFEKLN